MWLLLLRLREMSAIVGSLHQHAPKRFESRFLRRPPLHEVGVAFKPARPYVVLSQGLIPSRLWPTTPGEVHVISESSSYRDDDIRRAAVCERLIQMRA